MKTRISLGCFLWLATSGGCLAAGGAITQRATDSGAVELSNLGGDEDAQVVVAPPAVEAAVPARAPTASPASAAAVRVAPAREKRNRDATADDEDAAGADVARADRHGSDDEAGPAGRSGGDRGWPAAASAAGGLAGTSYSGGMGSTYLSAGGMTSGTTAASSSATAATAAATDGNAAGASASTSTAAAAGGSGSGSAGGTPATPATVLDSPEALAARLAQYRELMVNAPLGTDGQPANPAVVRRYRMISRSGFWAAGF